MSKYKGPMTAEELMKRLSADPEYLRMRAEQDEKRRILWERLDSIERPYLKDLADAGFPADSIENVVEKYAPLPDVAVHILLNCLKDCRQLQIQDSLIRALGAAQYPFDGRLLIDLLNAMQNVQIQFAILNTIALAKPHSIDDWLEKARQDDYLRKTLTNLGYKWKKSR